MSKISALYTDRVAPGLEFSLPTVVNASVELSGYFTRKSNGFGQKMTRPGKGTNFNPADSDTETFWILKVDGVDDLWGVNVAQLNRYQGFKDCIEIDGDQATLADGVVMTASGDEVSFSIQA